MLLTVSTQTSNISVSKNPPPGQNSMSTLPELVRFQRVHLSIVAEIPDDIAGARLAIQKTHQRFDAVSVDQQHVPNR